MKSLRLRLRSGEWGGAPLRSAWGVGSREKHAGGMFAVEAPLRVHRKSVEREGKRIEEEKVENLPTPDSQLPTPGSEAT